jgi:zinc transport system substrate-binding protein
MKLKKIFLVVLIAFTTVLLAGCEKTVVEDENVVYVTVYPMQFLLEHIGGDVITVKRVPGSTAHSESIEWSGPEIIDMLEADYIFYVGAGVDNYIPNNEDNVFGEGNVELINISEYVTYNQVCYSHTHDDEEEPLVDPVTTCDENQLSDDPHFWLDPVRMLIAAELMRDKLTIMYPDKAEVFQNNFVLVEALLEKLDQDFQEMADAATKPIITSSMLFTYFHDRYEIEILSLTTDVHTSETIPGDIIEFVEEALLHEIHYIIFEANAYSPSGEQLLTQLLIQDPTAQAAEMYGLGNLTTEEIESGANYISLMYENLAVLEEATK